MFHIDEVSLNDMDDDGILFGVEEEETEISIPREVLESLGNETEPVRMASLLYRNMSGLLPERLEGNDNDGSANMNLSDPGFIDMSTHTHTHTHTHTSNSDSDDRVFRLASPVISASFQCDTCTTSNLSTPVQVTFKHTQYDQVHETCNNINIIYIACVRAYRSRYVTSNSIICMCTNYICN